MAEMMMRAPLFPGHDQEEQIQMIVDLISYPSPEEIASMSQNTLGSEILFRIPRGEGKDFAEVFEG